MNQVFGIVASGIKGIADDDAFRLIIQPERNNRHLCIHRNIVKARLPSAHIFPRSFRGNRNIKRVLRGASLNDFFREMMFIFPINGDAMCDAEKPSKGAVKQFSLRQVMCQYPELATGSDADKKIPIAGMRCHNAHRFRDVMREAADDPPAHRPKRNMK